MVSRVKRTDYGLVSCQYERNVIAGIDRRYERERRASKQEEKRDNQIEKFRKVDAWPAVRRQQRPEGTANH